MINISAWRRIVQVRTSMRVISGEGKSKNGCGQEKCRRSTIS